jgi:hypothetical protein
MTDSTGTDPLPGAGWYPDSPGNTRLRWWDGQRWSEHFSDAPASQASASPAYSMAAPARNTVPATTPLGTVFIWIIVLLPLVSLLQFSIVDFRQLGIDAMRNAGTPGASLAIYSNPAYVISQLLGFLLIGVNGLLAYFDWRLLKKRQVERPFFWAWGFLSPVYVIGRSVVLRRRAGRGLLPLWVFIGVLIVTYTVTGIELGQFFSVMMQNLPGLSPNA